MLTLYFYSSVVRTRNIAVELKYVVKQNAYYTVIDRTKQINRFKGSFPGMQLHEKYVLEKT